MNQITLSRASSLSFIALAAALPSTANAESFDTDDSIIVTAQREQILTSEAATGSRLGLSVLETPATVNVVTGDDIRARGDIAIIVTASRAEQQIRDVPTNVELITATDLATTPAIHITDVLKKNASIDVIQYPGGQAGIGIRGFRPQFSGVNQRVLTLINGRPAGATSVGNLTSVGLERIEVLKGSASSIYGASAMGGVVNFITRESQGDLTGRFSIGYGSFETLQTEGSVGGSISSNVDFDLGLRHYRQYDDYTLGSGGQTFGAFVQGNDAVRPNTSFEQNSLYARVGVDITDGLRLQGHLLAMDSPNVETPGAESDGISNQSDREDRAVSADIALLGSFGSHDVTALYYHANEKTASIRKPVNALPYLNSDRDTRFQGVQLQDNWTISDDVTLIVGGDWDLIRNESGAYNVDGTRRGAFTPNFRRENLGVFADATVRLWGERLIVNAGGRFDRIESEVKPTPLRTDLTPGVATFETFNPRAGIVLRPFDSLPIRLHASAGTGFVPPEASEVAGLSQQIVGAQRRVTVGNPDLRPESSESYDIGIGYETHALTADLTYFRLDVKERISTVITVNTPAYRETSYENAFTSRSEGLEASFQLDPLQLISGQASPLELSASLTHYLKREEVTSTGASTVRNVAKTKLNFGLGYNDGTFRVRFAGRYVEGMVDNDFSTLRLFTNGAGGLYEYEPFTVYDLSASWRLTANHQIALTAENITDKYYDEKGDYPMPGRRVMATYSYSF